MYVLGICSGFKLGHHDSAAALLKDGEIIAAAEEERFRREKHARSYLANRSIKYCLQEAGITMKEVDFIAFPLCSYKYIKERVREFILFHFGYCPEIKLVDHHRAHAASAYRFSKFDNSMILTTDYSGDSKTTVLHSANGDEMREIKNFNRGNSLGLYFGMITQFLGFQATNDEYKVMGLSSYGNDNFDCFDEILHIDEEEGTYKLNPEMVQVNVQPELYSTDISTRQERLFSDKMAKLLGKPRLYDEPITQWHMDLAASAQKQLEKASKVLVDQMHKDSQSTNLCLAGGVALNCVMNFELLQLPYVDHIFIQPAAGDSGCCLGAAAEVMHREAGIGKIKFNHANLGPQHTNEEIKETLELFKIKYEYTETPEKDAAKEISEGHIVAWFQGRMEYGPRALGNRSILADPRDAEMKNKINKLVKFREDFRPFAPSVLVEDYKEYFEVSQPTPFMTLTSRSLKPDVVPAVTHIDGTSRVQTVSQETNPTYHKLISEFKKLTGVPVVLNTSLNVMSEPIVCSPRDAVRNFFGTGMDTLYLGNYIVRK
ncbi:MAG: carbamoyl transferase [Planctomycetes bacterium]|nr:carbamoyl transferase [Planctomycetota bacterium]